MSRAPVRMVCLGRHDRSDPASLVTKEAGEMGAETEFAVDHRSASGFDQGVIDWRDALSNVCVGMPIVGCL